MRGTYVQVTCGTVPSRSLEKLVDVDRAEEFLAALAPDVTWTIPGNWPGISGVKDRAAIESFVRRSFPAGFPEGLVLEVRAVHQDGAVVLVEFTGVAMTTARKRAYRNDYCIVVEFAMDLWSNCASTWTLSMPRLCSIPNDQPLVQVLTSRGRRSRTWS